MPDLKNPHSSLQRSRRNLMKIGAIAASAIFADLTKTMSAVAQGNNNDQGNNNGQGNNNNQGNDKGQMSCFLKGTMVRTANGDKKIEDLGVGDLVQCFFGGTRPIRWVGRYKFNKSDPLKPWVKDVLPLCIARSALGPDVPHADLYISRDHALLIDGDLVPVCHLVNGSTITIFGADALDELEYFHVKLDHHDVIYAEGAPCEIQLNVDDRAVNFAEYLRHYGPPGINEPRCAPILGLGGRRVEIKSRLRSAISPWIDRREKLDVLRDRLEEGGFVYQSRW